MLVGEEEEEEGREVDLGLSDELSCSLASRDVMDVRDV